MTGLVQTEADSPRRGVTAYEFAERGDSSEGAEGTGPVIVNPAIDPPSTEKECERFDDIHDPSILTEAVMHSTDPSFS